jgi:hypothetical protein
MPPSRPATPAPNPKLPMAPRSPFLTREPTLPPVFRANRLVFFSAIVCLGAIGLLMLARLAITPDSFAYSVMRNLSASLLLAGLQYGLIAWHTRGIPESFGLGLATACSLWVSVVGLVSVPMMFLGLAGAPQPGQPLLQEVSALTGVALFAFVFVLANLVLLFATLRTTWLARQEEGLSLTEWLFGFFLPLLLLYLLRAVAFASL